MSQPTPLRNVGGLWTTSWYDEKGRRRWRRFGPVGQVSKAAASEDYHAWLAAWRSDPLIRDPELKTTTARSVLKRYRRWAKSYYVRPDGTPTGEASNIRDALRSMFAVLRGRRRELPVSAVRPRHLKMARQVMIKAGLARTTINQRVAKIRAAFRWAVEHELVTSDVWHALQSVSALAAGRTTAREPESVKPVPESDLRRAFAKMPPCVRGLVRLQLYSGCRPDEACRIRACDLDTTGRVWTYKPAQHKGAWRGQERTIYLGPRAQRAIRPWLRKRRSTTAFLFDPRDGRSKVCGKAVGARYDRRSYRQAVVRACEAAGVPAWSPLQLRHSAATWLRREYGLEVARVILGHTNAGTTTIYAEQDRAKAMDVIGKVG